MAQTTAATTDVGDQGDDGSCSGWLAIGAAVVADGNDDGNRSPAQRRWRLWRSRPPWIHAAPAKSGEHGGAEVACAPPGSMLLRSNPARTKVAEAGNSGWRRRKWRRLWLATKTSAASTDDGWWMVMATSTTTGDCDAPLCGCGKREGKKGVWRLGAHGWQSGLASRAGWLSLASWGTNLLSWMARPSSWQSCWSALFHQTG